MRRLLREAARRRPADAPRSWWRRSTRPACRVRAASSCAAPRSSGRSATWCRAGRWVRRWPRSSGTTSTSPFKGHTPRKWRADAAQAGGGCLIEHSIHDLDILRYCFGDVESVVARTANHAGHPGIEDMAAVTLSFASGFEAQLTSIWHDILSRGSTRRLEVFCREGMVWLDDEFRGPLHVQTSDGHRGPGLPVAALGGRAPAGRRRGRPRRARLRRGRPRLPRCGGRRPASRARARCRPGGPPPRRRRLPLCRRRAERRSGCPRLEDEIGAGRLIPKSEWSAGICRLTRRNDPARRPKGAGTAWLP